MVDRNVFARLLQLNLGVSQSDNAEAFRLLGTVHPLTVTQFESGREHNGWVVPHDWVVRKARISKDGRLLFDGTAHPMAVAGYSTSFSGDISKEELDAHLFSRPDFPDAYPFHCAFNYRPWARHWGFCVPHNVRRGWEPGTYRVELDTEYRDGVMLVGECRHQGVLDDTILLNAHTCHPCQANDDLSGVLVILELFKWLATRKTRYSYVGVFGPEHMGTVFYAADLSEANRRKLKLGVFVEMVGTAGPLVLQESFTGDAIIDRIAEYVLRGMNPDVHVGAFRTVVGNDETVWEAPGIEVPMVSISRWPYPEYHTSRDDLDLIDDTKLDETLTALKRIVETLEDDATIQRRFTGLMCLSNPKYDLYVERPEPTIKKDLDTFALKLGQLQDYLPRYLNGRFTIFQIAQAFDLPVDRLRGYLARFEEKGLVDLRPLATLDEYKTFDTIPRGSRQYMVYGS